MPGWIIFTEAMTQVTTIPERRSFVAQLLSLRRWEKNFLMLGVLAAVAGAAIRAHLYLTGDTSDSWSLKFSPVVMRVGMSILIGFFVGWALRSAIRLALSFAIVVVLAWGAMSYLGWVDGEVNFFSLTSSLKQATGWVEGQAEKVTTLLKAYVPSAFGATLGLLVGFRRR